MLAKRTFKPRNRLDANRDAKLIVIAMEDTKAAPKYFRELRQKTNRKTTIHVEDRLTTSSSPEHVVSQLDEFANKYQLEEGDELWAVIDVDGWGDAKLSKTAKQCSQKNYNLCVSNPCFELWLLLHLRSIDEYDDKTRQAFYQKQKSRAKARRTRLEQELIVLLGSYNKSNLNTQPFMEHVPLAIERARAIDTNPADRWPQTLGTRIYLLAEKILPS